MVNAISSYPLFLGCYGSSFEESLIPYDFQPDRGYFAQHINYTSYLTYTNTNLHELATSPSTCLYKFSYDDDDNLISITDRFGNQITVDRNSSGVPIAIISPDGITTRLTTDANNHLTRITYPDNSFYIFEYISDGLMTAKKGGHYVVSLVMLRV